MSFDIQWDNICNDETLALTFKEFLNSKLSALSLPHYLANLHVVDFKLGNVAPDITIRDINIPFKEFYEALDEENNEGEDQKDGNDVDNKNGSNDSINDGNNCSDNDDLYDHSKYSDEEDKEDDDGEEEEEFDDEKLYFDDKERIGSIKDQLTNLRSKNNNNNNNNCYNSYNYNNQFEEFKSIPMTPRNKFTSSRSSSPSNPLFMNGPQSLLTSRTSSGITPTMGHLGVGITGFGIAGGNSNNTNTNGNGNSNNANMMRSSTSGYSENDYFQPFANHTMYGNEKSLNSILQGMSGMEINDNESIYENESKINNLQMNETNINSNSNSNIMKKFDTSLDIQLSVDIDWNSQLYIEIFCDLLVNYPAPEFIRLPVRLKITDLKIHSLMAIAYISKRIFISFLCDIDDGNNDNNNNDMKKNDDYYENESRQGSRKSTTTASTSTNMNDSTTSTKGKERIDILKNMKIEGEIGNIFDLNDSNNSLNGNITPTLPRYSNMGNGFNSPIDMTQNGSMNDDNTDTGLVLRNIGKIEKFLINAFRGIIIEELAWPGWIELDFNEVLEEEDDEEEEEKEVDEHKEEEIKDRRKSQNRRSSSIPSSRGKEEFTYIDQKRNMKNMEDGNNNINVEIHDEYMSRGPSSREDMSVYSNDSYFTDNE